MKTKALTNEYAPPTAPVRSAFNDPFYSVKQIAELDDTSPDTVRRQIRRGELKATRVSPRLIRVRQSDYEAARAGQPAGNTQDNKYAA
jgi:excisionase family DNA binding protein